MSRRSEPPALPTPLEQVRRIDGKLYIGRDAWAECNVCGGHRDPSQFSVCPFCKALADETEHHHQGELAQWAFALADSSTIH